MSGRLGHLKRDLACVVLAAGLVLPLGIGAVLAEEPSADQIIKALIPANKLTRGLTAPAEAAPNPEDKHFIDTLRNISTRSLTLDERDKVTEMSQKNPSIDLDIKFEFNSAAIAAEAMPQVTALGQALSSPELKGGTFVLAGHTDAKGGDQFNQRLSAKRAESVKRFLADKYKIDPKDLVAVGYGKNQLKNQADPFAAENRRVQVINLTH
jgi:outer membrane protein OmpA-like peptidoglycan-associated protein